MIRVVCLLFLVACVPVTPTSRTAPSAKMILITPEYPVVRAGVILPLHTPVTFSTQFLSQQREAFGEDAQDQCNRMLRYELGKIEHHDPLTAFGTVSEVVASTTSENPASPGIGTRRLVSS